MQERYIPKELLFTQNERSRELHNFERELHYNLNMGIVLDSQATTRGILSCYKATKTKLSNRLAVDTSLDFSERNYIDLRAFGDMLLGTTMFDIDEMIYPEPAKMWKELHMSQVQPTAKSLTIACHLIDRKPIPEWEVDILDVLKNRPQGWFASVEKHVGNLYTLFERDIYRYDLLPRMNEHLMDDLEFFHGS